MTIKNSTRLIAALLTLAMMFAFVSCDLFKGSGSLELTSFIVDPTSVKTEYVIGEDIDFSGIKATAKYSDENLNKVYTFAELTITYADDITATAGTKTVTVSFMDPNLNVKQEATVTITVSAAPTGTDPVDPPAGGGDNTDPSNPPEDNPPAIVPQRVVGFNAPSAISDFNASNKEAGTLKYGEAGFSSQFAVGGQTYVIGNQNEFKFQPTCSVWNMDIMAADTLANFYADVTVSVKNGDAYVELTKVVKENNIVEYYDGEVLIVSINVYTGSYQFAADAANKSVKIAVAPSETYYTTVLADVVLEAKVINAYNVYEAWQLAVIDNYNEAWVDFKAEKGLTNVVANGIVLHKDIHLSADDVPQSFFYTTTAPIVYKNSSTSAETVIPAGTRYLKDGTMIYERRGAGAFVIEGNFFTLDTKGFPLVPSPGVFGEDAGRDYGVDFSNAALFRILVAEETTDAVVNVSVNNISLIGNAARDNLLDSTESLASAGGLIFFKSSVGATTTMDNVIGNSYFITYFTEYKTTLNVSNSKCYDSYQNAAFLWGDCTFNLTNSYVNGCGGPAIIAQSVWDENRHPVVNVTGSKLETHLGGDEIWFVAVKATPIVGQIKGLGSLLYTNGLGSFVDANGMMNIEGAIMAKGSSATDIITGIDAQGSISIEGKGVDRTLSDQNAQWMTMYQISKMSAAASGAMPPFLTVFDANGNACTLYSDGTNLYDLSGAQFNPMGNAEHAAYYLAFQQSNTFVLTQGGLSVVFEYYHY